MEGMTCLLLLGKAANLCATKVPERSSVEERVLALYLVEVRGKQVEVGMHWRYTVTCVQKIFHLLNNQLGLLLLLQLVKPHPTYHHLAKAERLIVHLNLVLNPLDKSNCLLGGGVLLHHHHPDLGKLQGVQLSLKVRDEVGVDGDQLGLHAGLLH